MSEEAEKQDGRAEDDCGERIEIVPVDWAAAFARLAIVTTEARVFLACGAYAAAQESLDRARDLITQTTAIQMMIKTS